MAQVWIRFLPSESEAMGMVDGYGALLLLCGTVLLGHSSSRQQRLSLLDILIDWYCSYSLSNKASKQILLRQYMLDKQKQVDKDSSTIFFLPFTSLVYKI
jgi:hypothetical protein